MDMYRFGNYICRLREEKGMTQTELSFKLDVSDKAVSKWENGQAFPRIETFERLAQVLGTTMQDILSASRDGVRRVCFHNDMCPVLQLEVDGTLALLRYGEARWIEVASEELVLRVRGDGGGQPIEDVPEDASKGAKLWNKTMRLAEKAYTEMSLHVECIYRLTNVREDSIITITGDSIDTDDPTWILPPFNMDYPRVKCDGIGVELLDAKGLNRRDAISAYKKWCLLWMLDDHFYLLPIIFPFLGLVGRWHCRRKVIARRIRNIDAVRAKEEQELKRFGGCLKILFLPLVAILLAVWVASVLPGDAPVGRTYEIAADFSKITCEDEVYLPIESLPEDAEPVTMLDAAVWEEAVLETDGFWHDLSRDCMVQLFADPEGRIYLWLLEDYAATMLPADGSERNFEDFSEHMLFAQQ